MICRFLHRSLSRPSPLISPCLPFYLSLSLPLLLSLLPHALLSVLSRRQSTAASVFGAKGDIEADLKTPGSGEAISLTLSALVAI